MDQQDKIAHLTELAREHFNEGNLSAAINAWQQVLELDAGNADARRGVTLAQQKQAAAAPADDNPLGGGPFDEPAPAAEAGGPFDSDATMMFSPGAAGPAGPAAPAEGFDADATMMFNPGDAPPAGAPDPGDDGGATMMFNPGDAAAAAASPGLGDDDGGATMMFNPGDAGALAPPPPAAPAAPPPADEPADADATMMFTPGAMPAMPAMPAAEEPADADATMMFTPGAVPPVAPPEDAGPPPALDFGLPVEPAESAADQTMLTPEDSPSFDLGPPPPAPPPPALEAPADQTMLSPDSGNDFAAPPPPALAPPAVPEAPAGDAGLEDFEMPSGGLEMAGPPDGGLGGLALPEAPAAGDTGGGGGFSFDLPPAAPGAGPAPPAAGGGSGDFSVPDLPSLGPSAPGLGAPPPLAPPPPPSIPDVGGAPQASGQFGEVDPGEIEDLAVPTVAPIEDEAEENLSPEDRQRREEEKAAEFAAMYGKEDGAAAPTMDGGSMAMAPEPSSIPWKLLIPLGLVIAIVCAAVGGFMWLNKEKTAEVIVVPREVKPPEVIKSAAEWKADYESAVAALKGALDADDLDEAVTWSAKAHEYAAKAELEGTPALAEQLDTLEFEQGWNAKFDLALRSFCIEDYESAAPMLHELAASKPSDPRPLEYVGRIFYNLGVQELQGLKPQDAIYPFEQAVEKLGDKAQAQDLLDFARSFPRGAQLAGVYEYTSKVDPLQFRKAGCN
jgi:tetratricopeptide (TPR) repeat protein